jgi:hypothetical protein
VTKQHLHHSNWVKVAAVIYVHLSIARGDSCRKHGINIYDGNGYVFFYIEWLL